MVMPPNATNKTVAWESSNPSEWSIVSWSSATGELKLRRLAYNAGSVIITARYGESFEYSTSFVLNTNV
jgi:uncharacterized protein YjdB